MKAWLISVVLVVAFLLVMSTTVHAEFIYSLEGVFAPTLKSQETTTFTGELIFPNETVENGTAKILLANEESPREFDFDMVLNLPASPLQPFDTRFYSGTFSEDPVTMFLVDYDQLAGSSLDASMLDGGGEWDGWTISFSDYSVGSMSNMQAVNEPNAIALLALGFCFIIGATRRYRTSDQYPVTMVH